MAQQQKPTSNVPVRREGGQIALNEGRGLHPIDMMRRFIDDLEGGFFGAPWGLTTPFRSFASRHGLANWRPQIEAVQKGDQYIIRADLPGMKKDDVSVEVREDSVVISGERTSEHQREEEGYFASERSYGQFYRVLPLPEGAITDNLKATFDNGVLEITVEAPPAEASRGRKVPISEKSSQR